MRIFFQTQKVILINTDKSPSFRFKHNLLVVLIQEDVAKQDTHTPTVLGILWRPFTDSQTLPGLGLLSSQTLSSEWACAT